MYREDSIAASIGASAAVTILSRLVGVVRGVALAWLIPQGQFGLFSIAQLVVNILLPLCSLGLYDGVTRYTPLHEQGGTLRSFVVRTALLVAGVTLVTTAFLVLFAGPAGWVLFAQAQLSVGTMVSGEGGGGFAPLMRVSALCVWALALYHTLLGVFKGLRMFRAVAAAEFAAAVLFTVLSILVAVSHFTSAGTLMLTYTIACLAVVWQFGLGLARRIRSGDGPAQPAPRAPTSSLITYSIWTAGTAVLWQVLSYYPMWYLLKVSDETNVGAFAAVRITTQLVQVVAVMATGVVAAHVTRLWEHRGKDAALPQLALLTKACLLVLIGGATVLSLSRPLMMRLFPSTFAFGEACYDPLLLFFLLVGVVGLMVMRLNLLEKPRLACLAWLVGVGVNVAASHLLLDPAAVGGSAAQAAALKSAGWAGVAGVTAALAVCVAVVRRQGLPVDPRTLALIGCGFGVGFGWSFALPIALVVATVALATPAVLSPAERAELRVILRK